MDERIQTEKRAFYKGRAKVSLRNFELTGSGSRTVVEKHIAALVKTFRSEGCIRLNPDNFVKALISSDVLEQSLSEQGLGGTDLRDESRLHFVSFPEGFKLNVLHGMHRLLAADRFLCDKWWVAEFYCEGEALTGSARELETYIVQNSLARYSRSFERSIQMLDHTVMVTFIGILETMRGWGTWMQY
jgi:hypothetical protein